MQKPLDPLGFKQSRYERPNQDWICGRAAEGRPCPLGPDKRGNCRATGQCIPGKKGDRWMCMRSEAQGGKCPEGPLPDGACSHPIPPCQPVRSLRKSRGIFVSLCIFVTAGALLILLGRHFRHAWISPGPLTNAHAASAAKCGDCHSLESAGAPKLTLGSLGQRARNDSALCLKCHQLGEQPLHPHGLPSASLTQIRTRLNPSNESKHGPVLLRISHAFAGGNAHADNLACAICHQEHHGPKFDLTRLTDAQCQACHSRQFASFENGHPEFSGYPYQRRTRIFFDHNSHLQQHFAESKDKAPRGCQDCHMPGERGRFMEVKNFNMTCAACHGGQIKGEGMASKGLAFFTLPGIDTETLAAKRISIGDWPKLADGKMTPFMELFFSQQPATRTALEKLRGLDLLDLTKATPEQLAAAEQFAWAVKGLLFHLVVEGQAYLMKEMKDEIAPAGLEVPRAALIAAQKEWMPQLLTEVANYQKGIKPRLPKRPAPLPTAIPSPLKKNSSSADESLIGSEDLAATPAPPSASATPSSAPGKNEDLTSGDLLQAAPVASPPAPAPQASPTSEVMPAEEWVAAGGWYRPPESFSLFYRPLGHADPFLVAWLTEAARLQSEMPVATTRDAFQKLTDPQTPGLCMKCHTIEKTPEAMVANWRPAQPNAQTRPFTTFNHTVHFSVVGDAGCQTCHALNPQSQYAKFFSGESENMAAPDALKFQSNFGPISKMLCVECHQPRMAGDACILCHRYHAAPAAGGLAQISRFRPH